MTAARCPRQEQLLAALALDHLAIGLVADKCTKLEKISEILLLRIGLSYMKTYLICDTLA